MTEKTCQGCGGTFPATLEHFHANGKGLRSRCRACCAAYQQAYREAHPTRHREYYAKRREHILAQQAAWRKRNRDKVNASRRKAYQANAPEHIQRVRRYEKRNPERVRARMLKKCAELREKTALRRAHRAAQLRERGLVSTAEAAELLHYTVAWVYERIRHGNWPEAVETWRRAKYYRLADVLAAAGRVERVEDVARELVAEYHANLPEEWTRNGFRLVEALTCRHPKSDVIVGIEHGLMCALCGKVQTTGRVNKQMQYIAEQLRQAG